MFIETSVFNLSVSVLLKVKITAFHSNNNCETNYWQ